MAAYRDSHVARMKAWKQSTRPQIKASHCAGSANCAADKIPKKRGHDYSTAASRLFRDADAMMHSMVLSQTQKPLVSLLEDYTQAQRHKGWEYGFLDGFANQTRKIHHLTWEVCPPGLVDSSNSVGGRIL